jgi:hypothetical protein
MTIHPRLELQPMRPLMSFRQTVLVCAALLLAAAPAAAAETTDAGMQLHTSIAALDAKVFDAYNHCDMKTFSSYFIPTVEFYHDNGGATFDRKTVIANTKKYICQKVQRQLLPASLKIYRIKDFGAIEEGEHRFCEIATGNCEGSAKFLMIWQQKASAWHITRVVSYGHRALTDTEKAALAKPN